MKNDELRSNLTTLISETIAAHKKAFTSTGGRDPEWAIWYAEYLQAPLWRLLEVPLTKSQLVYCLIAVDMEYEAMDLEEGWSAYCVNHLLERFARSPAADKDTLILYHADYCPYCQRVRNVIGELGIDVELRDVSSSSDDYRDLVEARQRATVPVLRIISDSNDDRWMPESADIIRYLKQAYA